MKRTSANEITRGQTISFRIPSDTPDHILKQLTRLKETERRNFSSKIADFVTQGVNSSSFRDREMVTIPLPKSLTKAQRDWLKHEHSEALLGSIVYQLISDPVRASSLLASFNSSSLDINEALYLQEEEEFPRIAAAKKPVVSEDLEIEVDDFNDPLEDLNDDLDSFDWESVKQAEAEETDEEDDAEELDVDDLVGGFLARMNS
ncbi:hypothetical protein [Niallia endozanthoxylica]|uniref:Uncharacterized protein n=1 Tax=Niallia endozanthoxylica TaxID=2036016 RepID=A0A5J5H1H1_9BACI|nr:hypothetical protein [Niallia endozanthoxylica]KAA9014506.1 hypothetical protein F4V44_23465 [Niallia endozanthoxylica]